MHFDSAFGPSKGGPGKKFQTQGDSRGIEAEQFILEPKLLPATKIPTLAKSVHHDPKQVLIEGSGTMFIGVRQRGLVGTFQDPKMSKLAKTTGEPPTDLPQRVSMSQMAEHHCHELSPTGETFGPAFGFVLGHQMMKF